MVSDRTNGAVPLLLLMDEVQHCFFSLWFYFYLYFCPTARRPGFLCRGQTPWEAHYIHPDWAVRRGLVSKKGFLGDTPVLWLKKFMYSQQRNVRWKLRRNRLKYSNQKGDKISFLCPLRTGWMYCSKGDEPPLHLRGYLNTGADCLYCRNFHHCLFLWTY